jgi:hypothetical protein
MDEVFKDISSEAEEQKKTRIMADIAQSRCSGDDCMKMLE